MARQWHVVLLYAMLCLLLIMLVPWRQLHGITQASCWAAGIRPPAAPPRTLTSMLVLVTFHWNLVRLAYLEAVLTAVTNYPTTVAVVVVTNQPKALASVAADRGWDSRVSILQELPPLAHPHELAFVHRGVIRDRVRSGNFTSVMYLEDDMVVTWPSLLAWAADHELLAPLGFQRGMVRFEFAHWEGMGGVWLGADQTTRTQLDPKRTVTLQSGSGIKHFVNLAVPYSAMWAADMALLQRFINSTVWYERSGIWGVRETAACAIQFIDKHPAPFVGSAVVPYDPVTKRVDRQAGILHISANSARDLVKMPSSGWYSILWDDMLA